MSIQVEFQESPRKYTVNGQMVPSVTQILGVVDRSGPLTWWAMTVGIKGVCQLQRQGVELPWDDSDGIVKLLTEHKLTSNHVRDQAATRGTSVHTAAQQWADNRQIPSLTEFPMEDRGFVRAFAAFVLDHRPQFTSTEVTVGSVEHGFAGRLDATAIIDHAASVWNGRSVLIDYKTSKKIYPEQHFPQVAGYELARREMGMAATDAQLVLRLGQDGAYELAESYATPEMFLAIKEAYDAVQALRAAKKKQAVAA